MAKGGCAWQKGGMAKGVVHGEGWHAWQRETCMVKGDVHGEGGCAW